MPNLVDLWLPIILAAVFVFIASSVIHMCSPMHKGDMRKLGQEADVLAALRKLGVAPGDYMFPCPGSMKEMSSPEMLERYRQGPIGFLTVLPNGVPNIGKNLVQWFVWCVFVGVFIAYLASIALPRGADGTTVFRFTGAAGILAYSFTNVTNSIWKGQSWGTTCKFVVDGLVYGLVTAAAFLWCWPAAA